MTLDNHIDVETLEVQKGSLERMALRNHFYGAIQLAAAGFSVGVPLLIALNRIAKNVAYSAAGYIRQENIDVFSNPLDLQGVVGFAFGGLMVGFGASSIIRGAMASHKADELAIRIDEIRKSPQYSQ